MTSNPELFPERKLDAGHVEDFARDVRRDADVTVRLGRWRSSGVHADAYLQGLLTRQQRYGGSIHVQMPDSSFATPERIEAAFDNPHASRTDEPASEERLTPTERLLGGTAGGLIVGHVAGLPRGDIYERQRKLADSNLYGVGDHAAIVSLVGGGVDVPARPTASQEREHRLRTWMSSLIATVLNPADQKAFAGTVRNRTGAFERLLQFTFEAVENTVDHGRFDLERRTVRQVLFVQLRRVNFGGPSDQSPQTMASAATADYLDRAAALLERRGTDTRSKTTTFLELTVADGGVGIPAWMADDLDVYDRPWEDEVKYFREALLPDRTTKSLWEVGRGQGFKKMLRTAHRLDGLAVVRSGRTCVSRTYLNDDGTRQDADFVDPDSDAFAVHEDVERPLLAGTVVSLLFASTPD